MKIGFLQETLLEDFFVPNGRTKQCLIKLIVINDLIGYGYWLLTTMDAPKKTFSMMCCHLKKQLQRI